MNDLGLGNAYNVHTKGGGRETLGDSMDEQEQSSGVKEAWPRHPQAFFVKTKHFLIHSSQS